MTPARTNSLLHHRAQVARARRYLRQHAAEPVSLAAVARAAGASIYHFARLYHAVTRETVFATLTRLRIEAGAARLVAAPAEPVSRIALDVGYQTPSSFNKAFRQALGLSPTQFREAAAKTRSACLARLRARARVSPPRRLALVPEPRWRRRRPVRFIYMREQGDYAEVAPLAWANLRARLVGSDLLAGACDRVGVSHDDPRRVDAAALRYDAGLTVAPGVRVPPGLAEGVLHGGDYAVFAYRGSYRFIADAFDQLFSGWVVRARCHLRPAPCLEIYRNDPARTAEEALLTELWIPIERAP